MENEETRIDTLARPKRIPLGFIDDSRSVYCNSKITKDWGDNDPSTKFCLTNRLVELTRPKPQHSGWTGDRPSPIWLVNKNALRAKATARLSQLATSKQYHPHFQPPKSVYTTVSTAAKTTLPSLRMDSLSRPKKYAELPIKPDSCWDYSEWQSDVSQGALEYIATPTLSQLAKPKKLHKHYNECRPVMWAVSSAAKNANPTARLQKLSRPKSKNTSKEYDNDDWYKVSSAAMSAQPTPRLEELSEPIARKVRQKRNVKN